MHGLICSSRSERNRDAAFDRLAGNGVQSFVPADRHRRAQISNAMHYETNRHSH